MVYFSVSSGPSYHKSKEWAAAGLSECPEILYVHDPITPLVYLIIITLTLPSLVKYRFIPRYSCFFPRDVLVSPYISSNSFITFSPWYHPRVIVLGHTCAVLRCFVFFTIFFATQGSYLFIIKPITFRLCASFS